MSEEPELTQAQKDLIDSFDPALVEQARKLEINVHNFYSEQELRDGIERFLKFNPDRAEGGEQNV